MNKRGNIIDYTIAFVLAIAAYFLVDQYKEEQSEKSHEELALKECIAELENQCESTIAYAIALEKENARLNKIVKQYQKKDGK